MTPFCPFCRLPMDEDDNLPVVLVWTCPECGAILLLPDKQSGIWKDDLGVHIAMDV